jgi:hypothetical protein
MAESIIDGTGTGNVAKVDSRNRLSTLSISETTSESAARDGNSYNINTGTINLTSANESGVLYIKNNGDNDIVLLQIGYLVGNSTGGTGDFNAKVVFNPTGGTVISGATSVDVNVNKNAGSSKTLTVDCYKGAEGNTITGGNDTYLSLLPSAGRSYVINTGSIHLPKGSSLGITLTPQSSNTSTDVQIFLAVIEDII